MNWTTPKQFGSNTWNAVIYANGKFVAVGSHCFAALSLNGELWQESYDFRINGASDIIYANGVAYADGKYVAVGSSGYITSSNDGVSWTTPKLITDESGNPITATLNSICIMP